MGAINGISEETAISSIKMLPSLYWTTQKLYIFSIVCLMECILLFSATVLARL